MTKNNLALVLAGHGDITSTNADALLDLNMPENVSPFTVQRVTRTQKGLKTALAWFEAEGLDVERVDDPIALLKEYKAKKGWDAHLVMVMGTGNMNDLDLMDEAHEAGITVKDLSNAYDDILPEEKDEVPIVKSDERPEVHTTSVQFTSDDLALLRKFIAFLKVVEGGVAILPDEISYREGGSSAPVKTLEQEAQAKLDKSLEESPFDGGTQVGSATKKPGTTPMFMNEDGHYRNAEGGRKKRDEIRVWLNDEELDSLPLAIYDPEA